MNKTMILCRFMKPRENIAAFTCEIDWNDRKARRNRDSAETELSRDYFQWRAELLRDKAEYYCQPNATDQQRRAPGNQQ